MLILVKFTYQNYATSENFIEYIIINSKRVKRKSIASVNKSYLNFTKDFFIRQDSEIFLSFFFSKIVLFTVRKEGPPRA